MSNPCIIHTGDNHIRESQFGSYKRGLDFKNSFLNVLEIAKKENAECVICSGDFLDRPKISSTEFQYILEIHHKAIELNLLVMSIIGNHDIARVSWIDEIEKISPNSLGGIKSLTAEYNKVCYTPITKTSILGMNFMSKSEFNLKKVEFNSADILVFHAPVKEFFSRGDNLSLEEFPKGKFKYIALGDIHKTHKVLIDGVWAVMPGSTELCEGGEDSQKYIVKIDPADLSKDPEFIPIPTRRVLKEICFTQAELERSISKIQQELTQDLLVYLSYNSESKFNDLKHKIIVPPQFELILKEKPFMISEEPSASQSNEDKENTKNLHEFIQEEELTSAKKILISEIIQAPNMLEVLLKRYVQQTLNV